MLDVRGIQSTKHQQISCKHLVLRAGAVPPDFSTDFKILLQIQAALIDTLLWAVSFRDFEDFALTQADLIDTLP